MLEFFIFEFPNRAIKVLGIVEVRYFHGFLWFFEIGVITSPDSPPAAPKSVGLQSHVLMLPGWLPTSRQFLPVAVMIHPPWLATQRIAHLLGTRLANTVK
jgi:hypothetical protein